MVVRTTRAESKAATRTELLDAARRVFVDRGYHGASLDLVAREAGYTKGAVYSAFANKADLFLAVYDREMEGRRERIADAVAEARARGAEPADEAGRDFFARVRDERPWTLALLEFRLHAARDPVVNAAWSERHRAFVEFFAETVVTPFTGEAGGVAEAIVGIALANGFALEHLALPDLADEERYIAALSLVGDALGAGATRR